MTAVPAEAAASVGLAVQVAEVVVTDEQKAAFLATLDADHACGVVDALRKAGVAGTRGQLRAFFAGSGELQEEARLARGWNLNRVEGVAWEVALDKDHPHWDRANARVLKAYHPAYRDQTHVEVDHGGVVRVEHERRLTIDDVVELASELRRRVAGSSDSIGGELPAAREILPAPEDR